MFGLGLWEIVVVVIAAIVLVNPRDLPRLFRRVGRLYAELRSLNRSIARGFREIERGTPAERPVSHPDSGGRSSDGAGGRRHTPSSPQ